MLSEFTKKKNKYGSYGAFDSITVLKITTIIWQLQQQKTRNIRFTCTAECFLSFGSIEGGRGGGGVANSSVGKPISEFRAIQGIGIVHYNNNNKNGKCILLKGINGSRILLKV